MPQLANTIIDLYERHARHWDAARQRAPVPELTWLALFCADIPAAASILDLGCGGGVPVAKYLIEHGFNVMGLDSSETMIALCRERFPAGEWLVGDMRKISLGRTFRGLIAWDSFFHLAHDDQRKMFAIFKQHSAPGAFLLFTSGEEYGEAIGNYEGDLLYHASLSESEYRSLLSENEFSVVTHTARDPACAHRTVWLAQLRA